MRIVGQLTPHDIKGICQLCARFADWDRSRIIAWGAAELPRIMAATRNLSLGPVRVPSFRICTTVVIESHFSRYSVSLFTGFHG